MILKNFPSTEEFYQTYWGKKPFIVRKYIPDAVIEGLIDGDTLAGLALEDDIKSRIITNNASSTEWTCEHGSFDDDRFDNIGDQNWSLLVQNVEQYYPNTAQLLTHFQFSPRWLIDDIMVSFSAPGGSVGPHTDSYHTFLVQGIGKRTWKISAERIDDSAYAENLEMKVLANGFEGETFEVTQGDVIYMPPFFGHEGRTIKAAMTFSVGFLGPKMSEILGEYAQFLDENEALNTRYFGEGVDEKNAGFIISPDTQKTIQNKAINTLSSDHFTAWLTTYFSAPTHEEIEEETKEKLSNDAFSNKVKNGAALYRAEHVKLAITKSNNEGYNVAAFGMAIHIKNTQIIHKLNSNQIFTLADLGDDEGALEYLIPLYQNNILSLK